MRRTQVRQGHIEQLVWTGAIFNRSFQHARDLSGSMVERCREKVVLRVEMCVKAAMGKASAAHYFSNADVGNATFPERGGSGFHNALACRLLLILRPRHVRWLPSLDFGTRSGTHSIPPVIDQAACGQPTEKSSLTHYYSSHILSWPYDVRHMELQKVWPDSFLSRGLHEYSTRRSFQFRCNDWSCYKACDRRDDSLWRVARARAYQCQRAGSRLRVVVDRGFPGWMARNCMGAGCPRSVCFTGKWFGNRPSGVRSRCYPHPTRRSAVGSDPIGSPDRRPGRRSTFLASW